jgi:hypothetical protein
MYKFTANKDHGRTQSASKWTVSGFNPLQYRKARGLSGYQEELADGWLWAENKANQLALSSHITGGVLFFSSLHFFSYMYNC